jgi:hypothetical protein
MAGLIFTAILSLGRTERKRRMRRPALLPVPAGRDDADQAPSLWRGGTDGVLSLRLDLQLQPGESRQTVAGGNRDSSRPSVSRADWLGREHARRRRRWALEEQLLGSSGETENETEKEGLLRGLAGRVSEERVALSQLETELQIQRQRVSALERELEAIDPGGGRAVDPAAEVSTLDARPPRSPLILRSTNQAPDCDYWLSRCEGFLVESPAGRSVGVVEGVRFALQIDRPDLLEVAVGRLRRRVLLVPVDEVEDISGDDERVILDHDPLSRRDLAHELLTRARSILHVTPS